MDEDKAALADMRARLDVAEARTDLLAAALRGLLHHVNPNARLAASRVSRAAAVTAVSARLGRPQALALFDAMFPDPSEPGEEGFIPGADP